MAILEMKDVSFSYPDKTLALQHISIQIEPGECTVIGGASGSGKSTLLRMLKREVQPVGLVTGEILYDGIPLQHQDLSRMAQEVAMIFQDPENQIVMDEVWQELAFGLENLGYSSAVIRKRVAEIVSFFGLEELLHRKTYELSGGQKQMVNLAAVLLMQPKVLLLDEPTSQLDPIAAREFLQMVKRLNEELGMTVILVEHRLEDVFALGDRVILMDSGCIHYEGTVQQAIDQVWRAQDCLFLPYLPTISQLYLTVQKGSGMIPTSVKEGRQWLQREILDCFSKPQGLKESSTSSQEEAITTLLQLKNIDFRYQRDGKPILTSLNLSLYENDFFVVVGGNGAGKTTMLQVAAGLLKPLSGMVKLQDKKLAKIPPKERYQIIGYLAQNPKLYFVHDTVAAELQHVIQNHGLDISKYELDELISRLGIHHLLEKHPYDCSGGEQQKIALAGVLLGKPKILLIDEPTKGLDPISKKEFAEILNGLRQNGVSILMVTHDIEFAASYATRCAMLFNGEIISEDKPGPFFKGNFFYTTVLNRIFREHLPSAITYEEVLAQWHVPTS
ncbi:MAG TPA: energy-coupling factor transporter ATPase [Bacillota bacterium]|nr:energy-coupling factor transporter ATPase [Bacillota bacterium]